MVVFSIKSKSTFKYGNVNPASAKEIPPLKTGFTAGPFAVKSPDNLPLIFEITSPPNSLKPFNSYSLNLISKSTSASFLEKSSPPTMLTLSNL